MYHSSSKFIIYILILGVKGSAASPDFHAMIFSWPSWPFCSLPLNWLELKFQSSLYLPLVLKRGIKVNKLMSEHSDLQFYEHVSSLLQKYNVWSCCIYLEVAWDQVSRVPRYQEQQRILPMWWTQLQDSSSSDHEMEVQSPQCFSPSTSQTQSFMQPMFMSYIEVPKMDWVLNDSLYHRFLKWKLKCENIPDCELIMLPESKKCKKVRVWSGHFGMDQYVSWCLPTGFLMLSCGCTFLISTLGSQFCNWAFWLKLHQSQ